MSVTRTHEGAGMDDVSWSQPGSARVFLPWWGWVVLVAALFSVVPATEYAFRDVGWNRTGVRVFVLAVLAGAAAVVTLRYANSYLPTVCGALIGAEARPSEAWIRQFAGDVLGRVLSITLLLLAIAIAIAILTALAKRFGRHASREPGGHTAVDAEPLYGPPNLNEKSDPPPSSV